MNIMMTNITNDIGVLIVSQFNPCKQFLLFKYHLIENILINLNRFPKTDTVYFVAYLYEVYCCNLVKQTLL